MPAVPAEAALVVVVVGAVEMAARTAAGMALGTTDELEWATLALGSEEQVPVATGGTSRVAAWGRSPTNDPPALPLSGTRAAAKPAASRKAIRALEGWEACGA
jgi:hypothetical protein